MQEVFLGEQYPSQILKVPPGVAHGYKVIQGPMHLFYITSNIYNPATKGVFPTMTRGSATIGTRDP